MMMAGESPNLRVMEGGGDGFEEEPYLDFDAIWKILDEDPDNSQRGLEDSSRNYTLQGSPNLEGRPSSGFEVPQNIRTSPSCISEAPDSGTGVSVGPLESAASATVTYGSGPECEEQIGSQLCNSAGSFTGWLPAPDQDFFCRNNDSVSSSNCQGYGKETPYFTYEQFFPMNNSENSKVGVCTKEMDLPSYSASPYSQSSFSELLHGGLAEEWDQNTALECSFPANGNIYTSEHEMEDRFLDLKRARRYFGTLNEIENTLSVVHSVEERKPDPSLHLSTSVTQSVACAEIEKKKIFGLPETVSSRSSTENRQQILHNSRSPSYNADDDDDVCILEDISGPVNRNSTISNERSHSTIQRSTVIESFSHMGGGQMKPKTNTERLIFRVALQDLSQPKSEDTPPEGVLAVTLLRHQKIALSWMVKKEKSGVPCSGGILADDQGLGKTISTIALILKERSPSSGAPTRRLKDMETLNLDEDDDTACEVDNSKEIKNSSQVNGGTVERVNSSVQVIGRPAAGTLIVCPTSVLRQWSEELHNKVTSKANLSVLVYHGSNRTKDPSEVARYDVVLTTYSIVSMEVPKQPIDEDDDETGKRSQTSPLELSSSKKRKYPPTSKNSSKSKKGVDSDFLENIARPLARVGWFRVVLDEAQSIKNHRTQVARACWGLRAKRRWCLSGTPIQNAVDDLYSYFRFLRYDPYAKYKLFCSSIKIPIQRNPRNGYKKLQAVLKTIMLRRTKCTLLDGEPIINLPPKNVELRKVEFTKEERDFYCRLEADSRAQFAEYAAAGTVKQNYVNILLMLLRLRQACDHPLLVRGYTSNSAWRSSVETAKTLPRERQMWLLNRLEASLAICGICNDPPEDAVVTACGHVFCNQCISERLTGDDTQCPAMDCKTQLSVSSIFSITTLRSSLSDQANQGINPDCRRTDFVDESEPTFSGDSSKIKAALDVLQSLSKPQACASLTSSSRYKDEEACWLENSPDSHKRDLPGGESSDNLATVMGEKAIVFSQWTRMLDLLEVCLKNSSIQYRRLDGTMSVAARDKAVKDFNTLPEVSVMIMSLKAASLGLNMVAACHVLLLDLWWNPTTEDQAVDRAHRIGQTRPVTVLRLTVEDTVEDRILALQQKKRKMVASAFGEDETGSRQTRLTVEDLEYLFKI